MAKKKLSRAEKGGQRYLPRPRQFEDSCRLSSICGWQVQVDLEGVVASVAPFPLQSVAVVGSQLGFVSIHGASR